MANLTYSDKLKNPLWQKKRLEILNRDNFTCVLCSDTETELHIHHKEYKWWNKPWEYENDNFQTLCKHCHAVTEVYKKLDMLALVASKIYKEDSKTFLITTILNCVEDGLFVSVDSYQPDNKIMHIYLIKRGRISAIDTLFYHAKKLLK